MRSSKDSLFLNIEEEKKRKTIRKTTHTLENYICSKRVQIKLFFLLFFCFFSLRLSTYYYCKMDLFALYKLSPSSYHHHRHHRHHHHHLLSSGAACITCPHDMLMALSTACSANVVCQVTSERPYFFCVLPLPCGLQSGARRAILAYAGCVLTISVCGPS